MGGRMEIESGRRIEEELALLSRGPSPLLSFPSFYFRFLFVPIRVIRGTKQNRVFPFFAFRPSIASAAGGVLPAIEKLSAFVAHHVGHQPN